MTLVLALGVGRSEVGGLASKVASWARGLGLGPEGGCGLESRGHALCIGGVGGLCSSRTPREPKIPGKCLQQGGVRATQ